MPSFLDKFNRFRIKFTHFEFWPFGVLYIPILFKWFWDSLRARSFTYFTASNPLMEHGGFIYYSKHKIIEKFPDKLVPKTVFIGMNDTDIDLDSILEENELEFPLIAKPDKRERGKHVSKINTRFELRTYLKDVKEDIILQEFIDLPLEFGVMYYRIPGETKGHVSSVLERKFLELKGDGQRTLEELILSHPRAKLYYNHLRKKHQKDLHKIPLSEHIIKMEPIGNHRFGTIFKNANDLKDDRLTDNFKQISNHLDGFYIGRYDVKVKSIEDLYTGDNLKILELNGANSEPGHIYDPDNTLISAYKDLFKHWNTLYKISIKNHAKGVQYYSVGSLLKLIFKNLSNG